MFTRPLFHTPDMQAQHDLLNQVSTMVDAGTLNVARVVGVVAQYLGREDERVIRMLSVARSDGQQPPQVP